MGCGEGEDGKITRWGEIKCERCAEADALWEGMERSLEESDAREARSRRWREDLERWLTESETREATLNDRITMLEEERDALEAKLAKSLRALERIEVSTDSREQGAIAMAILAALKGQGDE